MDRLPCLSAAKSETGRFSNSLVWMKGNEDRQLARIREQYPPILTTAQVAELLDLNPRTVLLMAGDGRLPASRLPGSRKFHFFLEDVLDTLQANRVSSDGSRPGRGTHHA